MDNDSRLILRVKRWLSMQVHGSETVLLRAITAAVAMTAIWRLPDILAALPRLIEVLRS